MGTAVKGDLLKGWELKWAVKDLALWKGKRGHIDRR